jgi:hypothetical protein
MYVCRASNRIQPFPGADFPVPNNSTAAGYSFGRDDEDGVAAFCFVSFVGAPNDDEFDDVATGQVSRTCG